MKIHKKRNYIIPINNISKNMEYNKIFGALIRNKIKIISKLYLMMSNIIACLLEK